MSTPPKPTARLPCIVPKAHPPKIAASPTQSIEYSVSYVYHSLYAYFSRDNVALPGFAAFFKAGSEEEREHAELLMDYQVRCAMLCMLCYDVRAAVCMLPGAWRVVPCSAALCCAVLCCATLFALWCACCAGQGVLCCAVM
jgi:hypothetical protein